MKSVLNVGCGERMNLIPRYFDTWQHVRLDLDPLVQPDLLIDARELNRQPPATYDAVYCAHNLEHYHRHHGQQVVQGFRHVLKPDGFVEVRVPDLEAVMKAVVEKGLDVDDTLTLTIAGPILVRDLLYGYHVEIEQTNQDFYAHRTGFTPKSLSNFFRNGGFTGGAFGKAQPFEIRAFFFVSDPRPEQLAMLGLRTGSKKAEP